MELSSVREILERATQNGKILIRLGSGFFADAYNLFVIDIVLSILKQLSIEDAGNIGYSTSASALVASATSTGAIVGMILFGIIGDRIGRKVGVLCTATLVAAGSIASACCSGSSSTPLMTQLVICQGILGVGIGGEYPLSATMASEGSAPAGRTRLVASVFAMQGVGMLFSPVLALVFLEAGVPLQITWRLLLAFGAVPALIALYFRVGMHLPQPSTIPSTATTQPSTTGTPVAAPVSTIARSVGLIKAHKTTLIGTALCWFLLDIAFYGTGEFKHAVHDEIEQPSSTDSSTDLVKGDAIFSVIVAAIALPGYLCTVAFIDRIGMSRLQLIGFLTMMVSYICLALAIQFNGSGSAKLVLFGLSFFFTNFGPNATTFILPSEIFPHEIRSTCHGLSAAAGKAGAVLGSAGFPLVIASSLGLEGAMFVCAGIAIIGYLVSHKYLSPKKVAHLLTVVDPPSSKPEEGTEVSEEPMETDSSTISPAVIGRI